MAVGSAARLYLLAEERRGEFDALRADRALTEIRETLGGDGAAVAVHAYHAADCDLRGLADAIETASLFGTRTLVVVRGAETLSERAQERLTEAIERQAPQVTVVVVARGADMRRRFFARCRERGQRVAVDHPRPAEMRGWVDELARARGRALEDDARDLLIEVVGRDLLAVASELDKLAAAVAQSRRITSEDVRRVTVAAREHGNFEVTDAVCARDAARATRLLAETLDRGGQPIALIGAMAAALRPVLAGAELVARGRSVEEAARELGILPYQRRVFQVGARSYRPGELRRALLRLAQVDVMSKTGVGDPRALIEDFVLDVCRGSTERAAGKQEPVDARGR